MGGGRSNSPLIAVLFTGSPTKARYSDAPLPSASSIVTDAPCSRRAETDSIEPSPKAINKGGVLFDAGVADPRKQDSTAARNELGRQMHTISR